ncbi:MAG: cytochrome c [Nitrospinae bacterium]|nr:cytochrome c [Nitrospinota bacterium]
MMLGFVPGHGFAETGSAANGETIYVTHCLPCHGSTGEGNGPVAPMLEKPPANLAGEDVWGDSDKELLQIIRNGVPGTPMPPWKESLSDQHIRGVLAYIRSLAQ